MKSASQALIDLLASGTSFFQTDIYTISLRSGQTYYHTALDMPVVVGGITYGAQSPIITRTSTRLTCGVEVDEMTLTLKFEPDDVMGTTYLRDMRNGVFDGAKISVRKAFFTDFTQPAIDSVYIFEGNCGDVVVGSQTAEISVKSVLELFNTMVPRSLYQASCRNVLFDPATCKVNKATHTLSTTVSAVTNKARFSANTGKPAGWYANGTITFTSGANVGLSSSIKSFDGANFVLNAPLLFEPAVGDAVTIYTGCDRLLSTCQSAKFNNAFNFNGEPFVPAPEVML